MLSPIITHHYRYNISNLSIRNLKVYEMLKTNPNKRKFRTCTIKYTP